MSPPAVLFEITRQCDRDCSYCYNRDRREPDAADLEPARLESLLERLGTRPLPEVTIIGGEPLCAAQLNDVAARFCARGHRVALSTNALQLDRERLSELRHAGVTAFEVSLDCVEPQIHAALTGAPGLERVRHALAELTLTSANVAVSAMLTQANLAELDELLRLCFALGVSRIVLNQVAPVGQARARAASLALSDAELAAACSLANERSAELGLCIGIGLPVEPCRIDRTLFPNLQFEACRCGEDKWLLEPNGDVRVCELSDAIVGNLFETSLQEMARSQLVTDFRRHTLQPACAECGDWSVCRGGCRFAPPHLRSVQDR